MRLAFLTKKRLMATQGRELPVAEEEEDRKLKRSKLVARRRCYRE